MPKTEDITSNARKAPKAGATLGLRELQKRQKLHEGKAKQYQALIDMLPDDTKAVDSLILQWLGENPDE